MPRCCSPAGAVRPPPRTADPLRAQIKALEAMVKADRAEQRAAEAIMPNPPASVLVK